MRYGIFSDVHSNLEAFQAVVKAYEKEKIDKYLCLGDVVGYGADPNECVEINRSLSEVTLAGNHDWAAVNMFSREFFNKDAKETIVWTSLQLSDNSRSYLQNLKLVKEFNDFVLVHGSLSAPEKFDYLLNVNDCQASFQLMRPNICFVGHTHVPVVYIKDKSGNTRYEDTQKLKIESGNKYIINVGSVGQPRDSIPKASFCIWDTEKHEVEIKRALYDVFMARQKIIDKGLPEFLGNRLLVGN
jgi:predicted phosphodiesterase